MAELPAPLDSKGNDVFDTVRVSGKFNLNYIRAAIYARTGKNLKLREVAKYLVEEGFITKHGADRALHFSYDGLHQDGPNKVLEMPKPVDQIIVEDNWEEIKEGEIDD